MVQDKRSVKEYEEPFKGARETKAICKLKSPQMRVATVRPYRP